MTVNDARDHYDTFETERVARDCRDCEHTVIATVPAVEGHADTWIRCSECSTINRVKGTDMGPGGEDAQA